MGKNVSIYVTIGLFLIGCIAGFGKLQANVIANDKTIEKLEAKVEDLKTKSTESEVTDKYIVEKVDKIEQNQEKVVALLLEIKDRKK